MNNPRTHHRNWDEFRWEQEIRRDERRINCFFRILPLFLDLPGEEEMISSTIASQRDLMPETAADSNVIAPWSYLQLPEEDEEQEQENVPEGRRPGEHIIESIDTLASQWNIHCAITPQLQYAALTIGCAYAKLLARCADFFDVADNNTALKRCLGKRCLCDLLELHNYLELLVQSAPEERQFAGFQQKRLIGLREELSKMLAKYK